MAKKTKAAAPKAPLKVKGPKPFADNTPPIDSIVPLKQPQANLRQADLRLKFGLK
jgi:hypothetical protein